MDPLQQAQLRAFMDNPTMVAAVKSFFALQHDKMLGRVNYKTLTNQEIGEIHRGIKDGAELVEQSFREMAQQFSSIIETPEKPMRGR